MFKKIFKGLKIVFQDRSSYTIALVASLAIGYLYYWLLYKVTSFSTMLAMAENGDFGRYSYAYFTTYWITTIATVVVFGISVAVLAWLWKRSILSKLGQSSGGLGAFAGALGAACPVCGAFLLSLFGIVGGVSAFPLQGLELKFLSLGLIMASTSFGATRVTKAIDCKECEVVPKAKHMELSPVDPIIKKGRLVALPLEKVLVFALAALFLVNQLFIGQAASSMGIVSGGNFVTRLFSVKTASALTIIAPKINPDGKTTSLVEQPTISEVPGNPNTGDALADAKVVMTPTGKPFYAPDDISFDDPINAQNKWGAYKDNISLTGDLQNRYNQLINTFTCNYCCGGPTNVTVIARCGCRHAKAWSGFFKYMLQNYGDKYTDEQLKGEAYRWSGIWYPKGVLEDYLLATGKANVLGHATHGGAGADGRHGL